MAAREKIARYQHIVQSALQEYAGYGRREDYIDVQLSFDTERNHYYLFNAGWQDEHRIYGCVLHVDIKNGKIWIQHDGTEIGIANAFLNLGVPKEDIVLAFHSPYRRQFTGFGVS